jgi:prepilin-type N-terminal cleavage/methylation domain-containing protein/prepilin-type processing-associated H-X9-DG protein
MQTMKANKKLESNGFTLVELLVVVAIIATLAALSLTMGPRMMGAARASESMQNLRQIGPLLATYATEHDMKLPAAKGPVALNDGTTADLQWHETCLRLLFPETPPAEFKTAAWWKNHKTILRNPLFKENATPRGWSPLNPGYALNEMIPENLALASTGVIPAHAELLMIRVPLAALGDPGRTPLIAPCDNFFFRYDAAQLGGFKSGTLKDLLSEGKVPVLFVDGHVEAISPSEYLDKKLFLVPIVPVP